MLKHTKFQDDILLTNTLLQLKEYLDGIRTVFSLPLSPEGNEFSNQVWQILLSIPYGSTTTYGTIASELGNPYLAQRVGQAVGHNPISIIIPCHRVLGADGSLTGYVGGLEIKRQLLALEEPAAVSANRLF
ncbi:MAG TPA: methylated-DNA--[protein]-cysteine S-methyltransferase [Microbacteriaceae bacterium]|nr:methylated-DNA--[protein]-cysteine S-methyltransferase [Microbacteriaceae bacterium]